jgi:C-terminal processing protease CtpA/Prc
VASLADPVAFKLLPNSQTGYIRLAEFNARGPPAVKHAIEELEKQVRAFF